MFNICAEMLHQENGLNIENVLTKENKKLCYIDAQQNKILHLESVLEVVRLNICRSCLRTLLRENLFWPNVNISRERLSLVWHQGWRQVYKTAANHNRREIYVDGSEKYRKIRNHMILCL